MRLPRTTYRTHPHSLAHAVSTPELRCVQAQSTSVGRPHGRSVTSCRTGFCPYPSSVLCCLSQGAVFKVFLHPRDQMSTVLRFQDTVTNTGPGHLQESHTPQVFHFNSLSFTPPTKRENTFADHVSDKTLYLEYVKNSYNLQTNLKTGKGAEQPFLQRHTNGQQAHEKTSLVIRKYKSKQL